MIAQSVAPMVAEVQTYVPGYRPKQAVQFEHIGSMIVDVALDMLKQNAASG